MSFRTIFAATTALAFGGAAFAECHAKAKPMIGGAHMVPTLGGCMLEAKMDGDKITLTDENGTVANVTIADVVQSNGVIHVIDAVMTPKM